MESDSEMDFEADTTTGIEGRRQRIKAALAKAQGLDLCFLLDATASMQKYLDMVKTKVSSMVGAIKAEFVECDLRVSIILYRDYNDETKSKSQNPPPKPPLRRSTKPPAKPPTQKKAKLFHEEDNGTEVCSFTTDVSGPQSIFARSVSYVHTRSEPDSDDAEDVFTGLEQVGKMPWQAASRVLVHICDAPCHGAQFHNWPQRSSSGVWYDKYLQGDKYGRDITNLLQQLCGPCQISRYLFCHITDDTIKMVQEFKKAIGDDDWIKEVRVESIEGIPREVISTSVSTVSKTISTSSKSISISTAGSDGNAVIPEILVKEKPKWGKMPEQEGILFKHKWYSSLKELLTRIKHKEPIELEQMDPLAVKIAPNPFSNEGVTRWPYYAMIPQLGAKCMVVKRFKMRSGQSPQSFHTKERYFSQMEVQTVAARMAHEFNDRTQSVGHHFRKVEFTTVSTLYAGFKNYNMEEHLEGSWIRYSNNAGYVVNTKEYAATLQAFTHWTFEHSEGELMITDLQGVAQSISGSQSYTFRLCDPAIHCKDLMRFTGTNLGEDGFTLFFRSHECQDACRLLGLQPRTHANCTATGNFPSLVVKTEALETKSLSGRKRRAGI